jgi:hypothetical protein
MEWCGFFNSNNQDRLYDAADIARYLSNLITNGICYTASDNLLAIAGTGMNVIIQPGAAWVNGYNYQLTDALELPLATASGAQPRIDRVVIRWSLLNRNITLAVLTGAPASSPAAPTLTRTAEIYELGLADILIPAGAISIPPGNVTDTRTDDALSGLCNSRLASVYQ